MSNLEKLRLMEAPTCNATYSLVPGAHCTRAKNHGGKHDGLDAKGQRWIWGGGQGGARRVAEGEDVDLDA